MPDTMLAAAPDPDRTRRARARMEKLAWLLDGAIRVPGTQFRFGLDSIIGLLPGIGDGVGLLLGAGILYESVRAGAPRPLIMKMLGNGLADALGGLIPGVGDVFDFAFRANKRNAALLIEHLDGLEAPSAPPPVRGSRLVGVLLVSLFLIAAIGPLYLFWSWWLSP